MVFICDGDGVVFFNLVFVFLWYKDNCKIKKIMILVFYFVFGIFGKFLYFFGLGFFFWGIEVLDLNSIFFF